ncbi:MAG: hypothetical protein HZA78_09415 [Candidatus Schekmanbacteria bacterium]|nr:hypothetical protein [Candidatus Schekmanbacteria bacterium]
MALDAIISKIESESRSEYEAILKTAQDQAEKILMIARIDAEDLRQKTLSKGNLEAKQLARRLFQVAELNARKELLQVKQNLLDEIFQASLNKLTGLPADKYRQLIRDMLAAQNLAGDEQVIVADADKSYLGNGFVDGVNNQIRQKGGRSQLQLVYDQKLARGGFILRRGMVEINNTFNSLLRAQRDELELLVAQELLR